MEMEINKDQSTEAVIFTDAAAMKVGSLLTEEENPSLNLRVYVTGGGCAGFMYDWSFVEKSDIGDKDSVIPVEKNANLVIDGKSEFALIGMNVDYVEEVFGSHFEINNPNAKSGCGCGVSFSV